MTARTLFLMRHGDAEIFADRDSNRALSKLGLEEVKASATRLTALLADQTAIVTDDQQVLFTASPYRRAQQTAQQLQACDIWSQHEVVTNPLITPDGRVQLVCDWLNSQTAATILMVTHQPFISHLCQHLTAQRAAGFVTASIMTLRTEELYSHGQCQQKWV